MARAWGAYGSCAALLALGLLVLLWPWRDPWTYEEPGRQIAAQGLLKTLGWMSLALGSLFAFLMAAEALCLSLPSIRSDRPSADYPMPRPVPKRRVFPAWMRHLPLLGVVGIPVGIALGNLLLLTLGVLIPGMFWKRRARQ